VKKLWPVAAVVFFLVIFLSYNPAVAFNSEATLYLAQASQETPQGEVSDQAGTDEDDEYDDEYDDEEDIVLIPDPWIQMNQGLLTFNDRLYFWLLKPVARGFGFIIPQELRQGIVNAFYNILFHRRTFNRDRKGQTGSGHG